MEKNLKIPVCYCLHIFTTYTIRKILDNLLFLNFFVRNQWVDSSILFGDIAMDSFCFFVFSFLLTFLLQVIQLLAIWYLTLMSFCLMIFDTTVCWHASFLVILTWIEVDWFINRSIDRIDWLIVNGSIDWLFDWLFADWRWWFIPSVSFVGFDLCSALRPWALRPLRVSVGPS